MSQIRLEVAIRHYRHRRPRTKSPGFQAFYSRSFRNIIEYKSLTYHTAIIQEGETVQIRIESNTMSSEVDLEEESQPVDDVEEVHENVVMAGKKKKRS